MISCARLYSAIASTRCPPERSAAPRLTCSEPAFGCAPPTVFSVIARALAIEPDRFVVGAELHLDVAEIAERLADGGVVGPEHLLADREHARGARLGLLVLALLA